MNFLLQTRIMRPYTTAVLALAGWLLSVLLFGVLLASSFGPFESIEPEQSKNYPQWPSLQPRHPGHSCATASAKLERNWSSTKLHVISRGRAGSASSASNLTTWP